MRAVKAGIAALAVCACGFIGWRWWLSGQRDSGSRPAATALATGLVQGIHAAISLTEPYRCARVAEPQAEAPVAVTATASLSDGVLSVPADGRLVVGVVADARDSHRHMSQIRKEFAQRGVELVVSLGGLGRTHEQISAALAALTGPWAVLALPGDRESFTAHRRACAGLGDAGVVDGARVRMVRAGDVATLVTFPGAPTRERLAADTDGCVHTGDDAGQLLSLLGRKASASRDDGPTNGRPSGVRVLLSHVPPRQRSKKTATDLTAAGVHVGERALADALTQAGVALSVHGLLVPPRLQPRGEAALDPAHPVFLSAGAADGVADMTYERTWPPLALVVTIAPASVTWEYLEK